jgi:hypothetical protein
MLRYPRHLILAEHTVSKDVPVSEGWHNVRVDYQDLGGAATAVLDWSPVAGGNTYPNWKGEYFANGGLAGAPVVVRDDRYLDFNWGSARPTCGCRPITSRPAGRAPSTACPASTAST